MLLNRIELFLNVAKHHNLGKTAREMHVSASSVCQRLKSLENDFGVKLYKKNKHGIELTGAGRTLLTAGSDVLNRIETLRNAFKRDFEIPVQTLTVGGSYNPSAKFLPSAVAAFQKTHPDVKVKFQTANKATIERLVQELEVDIAIVQSPSPSTEFHMEHFAVDHLTFFAHPTHPLTKKKTLDVEDLAETPLIVTEGKGLTEKMLKQLESRGLKPNVVLRCAPPDAVKAAVRQKTGIGILFYNLVEEDVKRKVLKILKFSSLPRIVGNSYIVYSRKKPLSNAANEFLKLLQSRKTPGKISANVSQATDHKKLVTLAT